MEEETHVPNQLDLGKGYVGSQEGMSLMYYTHQFEIEVDWFGGAWSTMTFQTRLRTFAFVTFSWFKFWANRACISGITSYVIYQYHSNIRLLHFGFIWLRLFWGLCKNIQNLQARCIMVFGIAGKQIVHDCPTKKKNDPGTLNKQFYTGKFWWRNHFPSTFCCKSSNWNLKQPFNNVDFRFQESMILSSPQHWLFLATAGLCASCRKNWTSWSIRHGMRSFSWWNRWNDDVFHHFCRYFFPNQIKIITNTNHFGQNRPQIHMKTPFRNYPDFSNRISNLRLCIYILHTAPVKARQGAAVTTGTYN